MGTAVELNCSAFTATATQVKKLLSERLGTPVADPLFISYDATGVEVRVRVGPECSVHRIPLPAPVMTCKRLMAALDKVLT